MKKSASILDYSYPFLDPAVWDHDQKLYSYHKDLIIRLLNTMYETYQLKQSETWITDIIIIGSLTTSKWLFTSDVDVHMVVDLSKFIETNMPGTDRRVAFDHLDNIRKEFDRAKILAPMTQHPIEFYFEVHEFVKPNTSLVGVYSIYQDAWLKAPVIFEADLDFEESKKQVMTEAESIAQALDGSFGKIDRQIDRISELEHVISTWGPDKQQLFYNKIEEKLKTIEAEILKDLELRQALIDARHAAQDPMADIEIKFKWLQRFGFFGILSKLKELMKETGGQVTLQELPLIKKIVTEAAKRTIKNPGIWEGKKFWSGMADAHDGQIYEVHTYQTAEAADWHHSFYTSTEAQEAMRTGDAVFFWVGEDGTIETAWGHNLENSLEGKDEGLKAQIRSQISLVNPNLKAAFLKEVFDKKAKLNQKYWIDPSGNEYPVDSKLGHQGWVGLNILGLRTIEELKGNEETLFDESNRLIREGWTRVTTESDYDFAMEIEDLNNIPSYLDNFVAKHYTGGGIEIDDSTGDYQDLEDPFPSLRKAIYQARRLRNAASKVFSKKDITAKTKKVKQGDYSCIMAMIPHGIAQEIVEFGVREIPDNDLYLDEEGNLGRELQAHITIMYGLLTDDAKSIRHSFNDAKPFKAKLGKVRHFQPEDRDFDVVTVEIISDDLNKANKMIADTFDCADDLPSSGEYKPHITIAYVKRDKAKKHIGSDEFEGIEVELDTLVFSPRKGNKTYFSIGSNKESSFDLHKIYKIASSGGYWIDPAGVVYDCHAEGLIHYEWVLANLETLRDKYGINIPKELFDARDEYFETVQEDSDNIDMPGDDDIINQMFQKGWVRVGDADEGTGVELNDLRAIPPSVDATLTQDLMDGDIVRVEDVNHKYVMVEYPYKSLQQAVNRALSGQPKTAEFLPSLTTQAPDNKWQFAEGGDDKEIAVDPDAVSDETTYDAPCTVSKPRTKEVWRQFISMFSNLFSKNDAQKIEAYDKELEEANKDALGEDETALEYSKGFYDPKKHDFPHNTTWDSLVQDGEPSKPTSVTYSPQISNDDNLDQNSPGGYPRRFMGKPKGEYSSTEGEANNALIQMLRNRTAMIEASTEDITKVALVKQYALYVNNMGYPAVRTMTYDEAMQFVKARFPEAFAKGVYQIKEERVKVSSLNKDAGSQSASVPDYLIDEWKTEQIHNDTDEEPYVNHDQRDYPYGMHDSPENTGTGIGWPKDNQPQVVKLDQLENPAFRNNPFNMTEYWVTYYNSMPMSDGIEKTNPD